VQERLKQGYKCIFDLETPVLRFKRPIDITNVTKNWRWKIEYNGKGTREQRKGSVIRKWSYFSCCNASYWLNRKRQWLFSHSHRTVIWHEDLEYSIKPFACSPGPIDGPPFLAKVWHGIQPKFFFADYCTSIFLVSESDSLL